MNRSKILLVMTLAAGLVLPAVGEDKTLPSRWAASAPTIDGLLMDWTEPAAVQEEDGGVTFSFRNDGAALYVLMVIAQPQLKSTIEATGVTLYFNAEGKKKKNYGILFKKKMIKPDEYIALMEKQAPLSEEQKAQIRTKPAYYLYHHEVLGAKGPAPEGAIPAVYKSGAQGPMQIYEFSIPLARPAETAAGVGAAPGRPVMVGIEWGGLTEAMRKAKARQMASNIAGEDIDGGTGQIIGSTGSDRNQKRYTFWENVRLAEAAK